MSRGQGRLIFLKDRVSALRICISFEVFEGTAYNLYNTFFLKIITQVVEKLDAGWWRGFVGPEEGWFPATYVHTLDKHGSVNAGFNIEDELNKLNIQQV